MLTRKRDEKTPDPINGTWRNGLMTKMLRNHRLTSQALLDQKTPLNWMPSAQHPQFC